MVWRGNRRNYPPVRRRSYDGNRENHEASPSVLGLDPTNELEHRLTFRDQRQSRLQTGTQSSKLHRESAHRMHHGAIGTSWRWPAPSAGAHYDGEADYWS